MRGWFNRARFLTLGVLAGGAVVLMVVVPALGTPVPDADRLQMTSAVDQFIYEDTTPIVQPLRPRSNSCELRVSSLAGPIATFSSGTVNNGGGVKNPGIFDHGIGIKSGGSNGTPCSETSGNEKLFITSNQGGWFKLRLNIEAKAEAWIVVELVDGGTVIETHQLVTGDSIAAYNSGPEPDIQPTMDFPYTATTSGDGAVAACADPNDSGPDSGPNDNCLWNILAAAGFDEIRMYTLVGNVSLEGGHDFEAFDGAGVAAGAYDSLFYRAHAPTAAADSYSTDEDTTLSVSAPGVLGNDTGDPGIAISAALASGPSNGTLTFNGDGSFDYVPAGDFNGTDTFSYVAVSGGLTSDPATVTITVNAVNDVPLAVDDGYATDEDVPLVVSAPGVLGNDSDVDGDTLTAALVAGPTNGALTLNPDGSFSYTPDANFNGPDSFTYLANDGKANSNVATVSITVNSVNDVPVALGNALNAEEDTQATFPVGALASDVDDDTLAITSASVGTIAPDGASITYDPPLNLCEPDGDELTFTVEDGQGGSVTNTVAINVACVNDAPVAGDDAYEMDEREASNSSILATLTVPAPGVLGNDSDVDLDPRSASSPTGAGGSVSLNADGSFAYTPAFHDWLAGGEHFSYTDSWSYTVSDPDGATDTATVAITVYRVVCPGEPVGDSQGAVSGEFTLLLNISDKCRRYLVTADEGNNTVTLSLPDPPGTGQAFFRGELTFAPKVLDPVAGTFSLGIEYSPNDDGNFQPLQICIDPQFDAGLVTSAVIPIGETWCLASALSVGSDDPERPGDIDTVYQVFGKEDPAFTGK